VRLLPKKFFQRKPDPSQSSGWSNNIKGVRQVPYRLQDMLEANPEEFLFVVEGEKDVETLLRHGFVATCSSTGSGKWPEGLTKFFEGRNVVIVPDNDAPGRKYAKYVQESLATVAAQVRVVELPGLDRGEDTTDWLTKHGHSADELRELIEKATAEADSNAPKESDFQSPSFDFSRLDDFRAGRFFDRPPSPIEWTFRDSLVLGTLGYIISSGGVGKSRFALQLAVAAATGTPFLDGAFELENHGRVFALFCEDSENILHHRARALTAALVDPHELQPVQSALHDNLFVASAVGFDVRLIKQVRGNPEPSELYFRFLEALRGVDNLRLVILDPSSRLFSGEENDSATATYFCSLLEHIAVETGATVLVSHHVNKSGGALKGRAALYQEALRGSTGFTNAARWQFNMAMLDEGEVRRIGGDPEHAYEYLIGKTVKKNVGRPEEPFYLKTDENGVLRRYEPEHRIDQQEERRDLDVLESVIAKVAELESSGHPVTKGVFCRSYAAVWANYGRAKLERVVSDGLAHRDLTIRPHMDLTGRRIEVLSVLTQGGAKDAQKRPVSCDQS
jgi:hypothetical protein